MKYKFNIKAKRWVASENFDGNPCVEVKQSGWVLGKEFIVEEMGQEDTALEDAHLIAAAPDLLQACIEMKELINEPNFLTADADAILTKAIHKALNIE